MSECASRSPWGPVQHVSIACHPLHLYTCASGDHDNAMARSAEMSNNWWCRCLWGHLG
jgi:hypothetical protein